MLKGLWYSLNAVGLQSSITADDEVWDGVEWVRTDGNVCNAAPAKSSTPTGVDDTRPPSYRPRKVGELHHRAKDISGERVGYLTALRSTERRAQVAGVMACDCGAEKIMDASEFKSSSNGCGGVVRLQAQGNYRAAEHNARHEQASGVCRGRHGGPLPAAGASGVGQPRRAASRSAPAGSSPSTTSGQTWARPGKPGLTLDRADNDQGTPRQPPVGHPPNRPANTRANRKIGDKTVRSWRASSVSKRSTMYYRLKSWRFSPERLGDPPDASRRFMTSSTAALPPIRDMGRRRPWIVHKLRKTSLQAWARDDAGLQHASDRRWLRDRAHRAMTKY